MDYTKKEEKLIKKINSTIRDLVYTKTKLIKAYNYYHGKRDPDQFRHLEENYGLGTPTSIEFVPLTRKHIDVLVGEYLTVPLLPKVSCKDEKTLSKIHTDKLSAINDDLKEIMMDHFKDILKGSSETKPEKQLLKELNERQELLNSNFVSEYEIAAQNIVEWSIQSRLIDFVNKRRVLMTDLTVGGVAYYRVAENDSENNVDFKVLNPLHTFLDRNFDSLYNKHSQRGVIREYLTKDQIMMRWGRYLKQDDIDLLEEEGSHKLYDLDSTAGFEFFETKDEESEGILAGYEVAPFFGYHNEYQLRRYPVYDVEWLQTDKEGDKYIMNRYRGVRIGSDIFILHGKVKNAQRSVDDPNACTLSINGLFNSDRNGEPYSLILATANLQDKYDIAHFYRDNLMANSGTTGDWIDVAHLPKFLGDDAVERLLKWKAYKKQGDALFDSSQNEGDAPLNTTFSGFDDTIKTDAVQALQVIIQSIEETCSSITGVFREKLGGIEQRDAVTNVEVGIRQSTYTTKQIFYNMDLLTREILLDILNISKVVFKKGLSGTLILGDTLSKVFTALPKYYTSTDFDIHIAESSDVMKDLDLLKQLGFEYAKNNNIDPDMTIDIITSKSLTKAKSDIKFALNKRKQEAMEQMNMEQQLTQMQKQIQQLAQQNDQLQKELQRVNQEKFELEKAEFEHEKQIEWYKAKGQKDLNERTIKLKEQHIQAEILQLADNNPNNDEIKNV